MANPIGTAGPTDFNPMPVTDRGAISPSDLVTPTPSREGSRARQRADTRERIFEAAVREFRDVGFSAAQIDQIAKKAGVARGTFYFHFPTKDDVLLELAGRIHTRIVHRVAMITDTKPRLHDFLMRVTDALIDEHSRVSEAGLHAEVLSLYIRRPYDLTDRLHNVPTLTDELGRHLRTLMEQGQMESELAPEQLSIVIMSSLFGILARVPPGEQVRETCGALIGLVTKGLVRAR